MYQEQPLDEQFNDLENLIRRYEDIREGRAQDFLDEDSFAQIIDYYDDQEDLGSAIEAAEMGMQWFPFSADLQVKKAALLNATGQYERALSLLENADILNPADMNLYIHKIDAYLGLGRQARAFSVLKENIDRFSGKERAELLLELHEVFEDWQEFDRAFECLVMLLEKDPENDEALQKIGYCAEDTGRIEESIRLHKKIIDAYPYNARAWYNLGWAFYEIRLYEKAIDAFQYVIAIEEQFEDAWRILADAHIRLRQYDSAIKILEDYLEQTEPAGAVFEALGYCFERTRRYPRARFFYHKALELLPDDEHLYFRIGHTYMLEASWSKAITFLAAAHKMDSRKVEYNQALGECYLRLESFEEAITFFMEAIQLRPSGRRSRLALIRTLYLAGYIEEALHQLDIAEIETKPSAEYNYYRSAVLLTMGRTKEGLLQLETGLNEAPRKLKVLLKLNPSILQHRGVVEVIVRYRRHL